MESKQLCNVIGSKYNLQLYKHKFAVEGTSYRNLNEVEFHEKIPT
jgi:hypothetical protein